MVLSNGYEPLKVVDWQKAILLWFQNRVDVLEFHSFTVKSPTKSFRLPSVLRLKKYINPYHHRKVKLSRQNVFLRDDMICQYCHTKFPQKALTIDHVIPVSRGGKNTWENLVTSCSKCNNKKGNRLPHEVGLKLLQQPKKPNWLPHKKFESKLDRAPDTWQMYLGELEI